VATGTGRIAARMTAWPRMSSGLVGSSTQASRGGAGGIAVPRQRFDPAGPAGRGRAQQVQRLVRGQRIAQVAEIDQRDCLLGGQRGLTACPRPGGGLPVEVIFPGSPGVDRAAARASVAVMYRAGVAIMAAADASGPAAPVASAMTAARTPALTR
jgi:hypothetical protein